MGKIAKEIKIVIFQWLFECFGLCWSREKVGKVMAMTLLTVKLYDTSTKFSPKTCNHTQPRHHSVEQNLEEAVFDAR